MLDCLYMLFCAHGLRKLILDVNVCNLKIKYFQLFINDLRISTAGNLKGITRRF